MRLDRAHFGASAARNMPKTMSFHAFSRIFIILGSSQHLLFLVCFFARLRKPRVFVRFLRFGCKPCAQFGALEARFRHFPSLGAASTGSFWGLRGSLPLFSGRASTKTLRKAGILDIFWSARPWHADNFVTDSAPGSSSMCQKRHFSSIFSDSWPFRHFLNLAWPKVGHLGTSAKLFVDFSRALDGSKILFSMFPKLIWTFLMADPEVHFSPFIGLAQKCRF